MLDLCAAPGGKSYLLTQHCDQISLHSNDLKRSEELRSALHNHVPDADILITAEAGEKLQRHSDILYDRVLIDAPCATDKHLILSTDETVQRELPRLSSGYYSRLQLELLRSGLR